MKMKWGFLFAVMVLGIVWVGAVQGAAPAAKTISLISAPFGTSSYVLGSALEDISKKYHPWLRITHSETPGLIFNIKKLDSEPELKKTTFVTSSVGTNWLADSGQKPFDKKYPMLKAIANYNLSAFWLATLHENIRTGKDLAGKKIALGRLAQIAWGVEALWVIRDGWGIADKAKIQFTGTNEAKDALLDGLVDAAIVGGYFDPGSKKLTLSPQTLELLASGKTVYHISFDPEAVKKTRDKTGLPIESTSFPPGTVQGWQEPLNTFSDSTFWGAAPEFPADIAYEITKLIIDNCSKFGQYHALGKLVSPQALVFGWAQKDIHPGALKAYKEAGILK